MGTLFTIFFLIFSVISVILSEVSMEPILRTCEPIRVDLCKHLGYNLTSMPNLGGNDLQHEAEYTLKSFSPLIQYGCSSQLKLFLCSVYVPMCTEKVSNPIGPCRGLCESVRSRCYPVLRGFGFPWPDALNCSRFPIENNHEHMCMEGPKDKIDITAPVDPAMRKFGCEDRDGDKGEQDEFCDRECPEGARIAFTYTQKNFAEVWVTVWAMICFVISFGSALTLTIGGGRIRARPLVSLALCYVLVSAGWGLRMFSGRISTCSSGFSAGEIQSEDGLSNVNCAFVFLMIYYFGMAANAWWVCLCAWWVTRVGLQWPPEKLRNLGSVLHVCAWGLPAAQTVAALVRRDVDSDELTGTCYVRTRNPTTFLALVLIPQFIYLVAGIILLIIGCTTVIRRPRPTSATPLTATTPRKESDFLGGMCALYVVPFFAVMAINFYEYNNRESWLKSSGESITALWAFLLRQLMSLLIGISSVFWVWSMRTVTAWRSVLRRLGPRKQLPVKVQTLPVLRYVPPHPSVQSSLAGSVRTSSRSHTHRKPRVHHLRVGGETVI